MTLELGSLATPPPDQSRDRFRPPRPLFSVVLGSLSLLVIALSGWLAVQPGSRTAQHDLVLWFNHPPQPLDAVLALVNPLLRPVPLVLLALVFVGWVLVSASTTSQRLEVLRDLGIALLLAELVSQVLKRLADQPRPLAVIPGLDTHGYPTSPHGNAYPSAHTALLTAGVCALWPWMRWPQRIAGTAFAVLVACNRIYIGAHWPIDVIGGAAVGFFCGALTWLIAARWPLVGEAAASRDGTRARR